MCGRVRAVECIRIWGRELAQALATRSYTNKKKKKRGGDRQTETLEERERRKTRKERKFKWERWREKQKKSDIGTEIKEKEKWKDRHRGKERKGKVDGNEGLIERDGETK